MPAPSVKTGSPSTTRARPKRCSSNSRPRQSFEARPRPPVYPSPAESRACNSTPYAPKVCDGHARKAAQPRHLAGRPMSHLKTVGRLSLLPAHNPRARPTTIGGDTGVTTYRDNDLTPKQAEDGWLVRRACTGSWRPFRLAAVMAPGLRRGWYDVGALTTLRGIPKRFHPQHFQADRDNTVQSLLGREAQEVARDPAAPQGRRRRSRPAASAVTPSG